MTRVSVRAWFSTFVVCLIAGCGGGADRPDLGYVSGTITMDEMPVESLRVVMKPDDGRAATGVTDKNGKYTIEYLAGERGTKIGQTTVSFEWPIGVSGSFRIDKKYATGTSTIKYEVKKGSNTFDYNLETPSDKPSKRPQGEL